MQFCIERGCSILPISDITKLANSEAVFAVLFIAFLYVGVKQVLKMIDQLRNDEASKEQHIYTIYRDRENDYKQLLVDLRNDTMTREEKLYTNLTGLTSQQGEISDTLKDVRDSLGKLENKMDRGFNEVWDAIGKHRKGVNK